MDSTTTGPAFLSMTPQPGSGLLAPTALWAEEGISRPFLFTTQLVSDRPDISAGSMLYKPVCITMRPASGPPRFFHGIVRDFGYAGSWLRDFWSYSAQIVPRLWFMSLTRDCRVFEGQTLEEILRTLFSDIGIEGSQFRFADAKPSRDYTVQWNETDLEFMTRLIERGGVFLLF